MLGKDAAANALLVGPKSAFGPVACRCGKINYLLDPALWPETVLAKTRYRQELQPAKAVWLKENGESILRLEFLSAVPSPPPAPGQVAAIYAPTPHGNRVLAGAIIL